MVLLVIGKTEELKEDMKFIGQMTNVSFAASLGENVLQSLEFRNYANFGFQ